MDDEESSGTIMLGSVLIGLIIALALGVIFWSVRH